MAIALGRQDVLLLERGRGGRSVCEIVVVAAAAVARLLDHVGVFANAVAVFVRDVRVDAHLLRLLRRPGQVVAAHLDVVVRELAQLVVVHAEQFGLLARAQVQARDEVDNVGQDGAHDERVACAGEDVGQLDVELPVVADGPAADSGARDRVGHACVDTVQADHVVDAEERVEHQADHAGDAVLGEHIHRVIDADPVLDYKEKFKVSKSLQILGGGLGKKAHFWLQSYSTRQ